MQPLRWHPNRKDRPMIFIRESLRWSLPLFWLGIASAAFFTATITGAAHDVIALLPMGWAALVLAITTAGLNLMWSN